MKTFTFDEAQALLPVLESLLKRARESKRLAEEVNSRLAEIVRRIQLSGGILVDLEKVTALRAELEGHLQRARESLGEIDAIGVKVKDLDVGLLDFPCLLDGNTVLLCWRMGEPEIAYWHPVDAGFDSRRPLDERFRRKSNPGGRPN